MVPVTGPQEEEASPTVRTYLRQVCRKVKTVPRTGRDQRDVHVEQT